MTPLLPSAASTAKTYRQAVAIVPHAALSGKRSQQSNLLSGRSCRASMTRATSVSLRSTMLRHRCIAPKRSRAGRSTSRKLRAKERGITALISLVALRQRPHLRPRRLRRPRQGRPRPSPLSSSAAGSVSTVTPDTYRAGANKTVHSGFLSGKESPRAGRLGSQERAYKSLELLHQLSKHHG